jgi:hypothetical protein
MRLLLRNSNARWRRMFHRELLRRYSRREFPGEQVFAQVVFKIRRAPTYSSIILRIFLLSWSELQHFLVLIYLTKNSAKFTSRVLFPKEQNRIPLEQKLLCRKSSSKRKSRAKVHPDRCHFEIIRV